MIAAVRPGNTSLSESSHAMLFVRSLALALFVCASSTAVGADPECRTVADADAVFEQIKLQFRSIKEDQQRLEAGIDQALAARVKTDGWRRDRIARLFNDMLSSPQFAAFEQEKRPYADELMRIVADAASAEGRAANPAAICAKARHMSGIVDRVKEVNVRQYAFMLEQVNGAE